MNFRQALGETLYQMLQQLLTITTLSDMMAFTNTFYKATIEPYEVKHKVFIIKLNYAHIIFMGRCSTISNDLVYYLLGY